MARELAARGLDLVLVARREDQLQAAAGEFARARIATCRVPAIDLARPNAPARVHEWVSDESGSRPSRPALPQLRGRAMLVF